MDSTLILLVLAVVAAAGVGGYLFVKSQPAKEEPFDHFRCPGCKHRLRYQSRQVGHRGKCSHCGHHLTFPPTSQSIS